MVLHVTRVNIIDVTSNVSRDEMIWSELQHCLVQLVGEPDLPCVVSETENEEQFSRPPSLTSWLQELLGL
jgi:hypothetical protein